jgi:Bacterial Ig domain
MRSNYLKTVKTAVLAISVLLLGASVSFAQQQVNLTAGPANATLPDGSAVPMWGYSCGALIANPPGSTATCAPLNMNAPANGWSPVVITVPTGQDLQINLTNNLVFTPTATGSTPNKIPTSIVIVGQIGGGLGKPGGYTDSPDHSAAQTVTWPIADSTTAGTPPTQGQRVQSFGAEIKGGTSGSLCWGVCGQNKPALRPGTYLIESGTHPSIQGPMGLFGILVVTSAPAASGGTGTAYPAVGTSPAISYNAEVSLLLSEIDPVQNNAVNAAVNTNGFSETMVWSGQPTGCGNPASSTYQQCYPPAVNYSPLYYLINGVAFNKSSATNAVSSLFNALPNTGAATNPKVLVRLVNAGSRMHVPSIVGAQYGVGAAAAPGFGLIAEDGNPLPGVTRLQSEVFMAAGKTYDVMINAPASGNALPIYDRELSLSANATQRDGGMLAYIGINGSGLPTSGAFAPATATAVADTYKALVGGQTLTISDPAKGVVANDVNVYGVQLVTQASSGKVTLASNGTFTYVPNQGSNATSDSFGYCANGATAGTANLCTTVTLGASAITNSSITCGAFSSTASTATYLSIRTPGPLANCKDTANLPLTLDTTNVQLGGLTSLVLDANGGLTAVAPGANTYNFNVTVKNSLGITGTAAVSLTFPAANGPTVTVLDGNDKKTQISDYRWVIEEDRTFFVDPKCSTNPLPASCPRAGQTPLIFGANFHTSWMPLVATGCTGPLSCEGRQKQLGENVVCDQGNGFCRPDPSGNGFTPVDPRQVHLDPNKRYYISILPGDAANPFIGGNASAPKNCTAGSGTPDNLNTDCGHGMGGAPIAIGQTAVTVFTQPSPYPPGKLTVFVFEDDNPLNGEHDAGGGIDVLSPSEPGLGGFEVTLFDDAGGTGDATGQPTYDMFNMPLTNSLAGTIDPMTGMDACPLSTQVTANATQKGFDATPDQCSANPNAKGCQRGVVGMIVTCPKYESDGITLSPMAGQAVINNLYQGRYGVVATPGADRIARGEEWLQTNTLDGQKAHDSFLRIGEPAYFQEFGPAGYHVTIGFANPTIINARKASLCPIARNCRNEVKGHVTTARMSRPPDERLYGSGSRDSFSFTQCYASLGDPDGEDFAFVKCDGDGNFDFTSIPEGNWKLTIFDQWNDQIVDGISTPVGLTTTSGVTDLKEVAVHQWQANIYTRTFIDQDGNGVSNVDGQGNPTEPGLALVATNIRFRDGSFSNFNSTDLNGFAGFNEVFPLFSWYTIETDTTRYKSTGVHVVYDAGGPTDTTCGAAGGCGSSAIGAHMANTYEANPLPAALSVPGAVYCAEGADCSSSAASFAAGTPLPSSTSNHSTGRIDPPFWFGSYGWQGFSGQNSFLEFAKKQFADKENGGIHGHVVYASTRPFDDPQLLLQLSWEPLVPHVQVNLYREDIAADGVTPTLTLVDFTQTSSFDDWAQGFRSDNVPNMNCPGQSNTDIFFFALQNQPNYLDWYQNGNNAKTLPNSSQFKCYDGMHNWNQLQPAPYDGMYSFPSVTGLDPHTGKPTGSNCTGCIPNPDSTDHYRAGAPMLPAGKYVVEVVVPPGYELVKEEDKNILIGDNFIAPVVQQFGGLGSIYIMPDQASLGAYNPNNPINPTTDLGAVPRHEGDTGSVEQFWPCVGEARIVPDFISLYPGSGENAPFAGATRNLCDRKEVALTDQMSALVKFYIFTPTHIAAHFTGIITDDFTAEFDPFSPQFGEKFAPANLPVAIKDWTGNETSRVYSDMFGAYTGLNYSTWEVNPPNPTGYGPTMMVTCMNDAGTGSTPDPMYQPNYSQFCYELPFMPGQTGYFDTPVVPTSAFSEGYNHADCNYPDATPAIREVDGDGVGPWVLAAGHNLTITALGDMPVDSYGYSGPQVTMSPYNQQKVTRHYGFGSTPAGCPSTPGAQCKNVALVGTDGIPHPLTGVSWSDTTITGTVPGGVPNCAVQQQAQYKGSTAQCGELVITTAAGKSSVDTVTVTIGGKAPTHVAATASVQDAIDAASPGDLLILDPSCSAVPCTKDAATTDPQTKITTYSNSRSAHNELLIMWKPIRLQGVGAVSTIINANTHPAGVTKMDQWRQKMVCLFGLALNGAPISNGNPYDQTNAIPCPANMRFQVDRLPLEATVGWQATLNGNLAEQLIEPTLLGAYEGAGITVVSKGVRFPNNANNPTAAFASDVFPDGTTLLDNSTNNCGRGVSTDRNFRANPFPSNFWCNPSSIDGLSVTNSSQGGGGILVHGWGHNIQIGNNRVFNNQGTLSGGITVGQGEHPDAYLAGSDANTLPGSCENSNVANLTLPFCFDMHVNVHHNSVIQNSSLGDELFSSTPAGAGGVTFCNGADYYLFNNNWVCGNMSTGDGGGVAHLGFSKNGDIEHNAILFNQSTNPTITTNGGGLLIMGAPDLDPTCGATNDKDCVPAPNSVTPTDGTGPGLVINANLILGNAADSGSGGGLRLQHVNGTDVMNFPDGANSSNQGTNANCNNANLSGCRWNTVSLTNNIIVNNVAGWDGAGVSLQDALAVNIVNNTIASNDSTASSGVLFGSLFAPLASAPGTNCTKAAGAQSCPEVSGLVSVPNSAILQANLPNSGFSCPTSHGSSGSCRYYSVPLLTNNIIWQNRSFVVGVGGFGAGNQNQQKLVSLYNSSFPAPASTLAGSQSTIGACPAASYWEIGVRGDASPSSHVTLGGSARSLAPTYTVMTDDTDYPGANNTHSSPNVVSQYCNGSRVPPALGTMGWLVPPGTNETNALPSPVFSLTPSATVDEGNNWINLRWGPLALADPDTASGRGILGNYAIATGSSAIDRIPSNAGTAYSVAPDRDYFGHARKGNNAVDAGAVEFQTPVVAPNVSFAANNFSFGTIRVPVLGVGPTHDFVLSNAAGAGPFTVGAVTVSGTGFSQIQAGGGVTNCNAGTVVAAGANCTVRVRIGSTANGVFAGSLVVTGTDAGGNDAAVTNSPVSLSGTIYEIDLGSSATSGVLSSLAFNTGTNANRTITVRNWGTGAISLASVTFTGTDGANFARSGGTCGASLNGTIIPGFIPNSCTIIVHFTAGAKANYSATFNLNDNDSVTSQTISLTATNP